MGKVDLVLVGSEAVVESGGLINAVGSYQMALIAKASQVPFYALAERCSPTKETRALPYTSLLQLQIPSDVPVVPIRSPDTYR